MQHNSLFSILLYLTQELQCNSDAICIRVGLCVQIAWKLSAEETWGSTIQLGQIGYSPPKCIWLFKKELPMLFWSQRCRERKQLRHQYLFFCLFCVWADTCSKKGGSEQLRAVTSSNTAARLPELTISALQYRVSIELLLIQSVLS